MMGLHEFTEKLKEIKEMGYVKTHRLGNTGIGKTLEDLIGIKENNIAGPDGEMIELKSTRKNAGSMITFFTRAPLPDGANSFLLENFGYPSEKDGRKILHSTVNAKSFNTLKDKEGFKVEVRDDRIEIISKSSSIRSSLSDFIDIEIKPKEKVSDNQVVCYWDKQTLKTTFEKKLPKVLFVKADSKGSGLKEEFWFNEAWLLEGFDFDNFVKLVKEGIIKVDIRIGQFPSGSTHDHGTGFRVFPDKIDLCFSNRERIL